MKRTIIILTAALCLGTPAAAMASDSSAELVGRILQLETRNANLTQQLDHKADVLACERAKRRSFERALRTGAPVGVPASCR